MKQIILILSFGVLNSFNVCNTQVSTNAESHKDSTKIIEKPHYENLADTIFFDNEDYELYRYIQKEFENNKIHCIKSIKTPSSKEYYNVEGELTKIEYLNEKGICGIVNIIKREDKYFYNIYYEKKFDVTEEGKLRYREIDRNFFINKEFPWKQTIVEEEIMLKEGKIIFKNISMAGNNDFYLYIYRGYNDDLIDKIFIYHYEYHVDYPPYGSVPDDDAPEVKKKYPSENNVVPVLTSKIKYKYDEEDKLVEFEEKDIIENTIRKKVIEYNERGLVKSNDIEYEYYK